MLINVETKSELEKFEDAKSVMAKRKAFEKKRYDDLVAQVAFNDSNVAHDQRKYIYRNDFRPYVYFFRFLAKRPDMCSATTIGRLKLWFPDTIINSEGDQPAMWLYTANDGYVYRTDNFTSKNITNKIGNFGAPDELVAVLKKV